MGNGRERPRVAAAREKAEAAAQGRTQPVQKPPGVPPKPYSLLRILGL